MKNLRSKYQFIFGLLIVVAVVIGVSVFSRPQARGDLKVYFLNVGQGDASYIKMPNGEDVLIDGGPGSVVLDELGKVMDLTDREINLVILTHPHSDHLSGLIEVLKRYKVEEIWETGVEYPSAGYGQWKKLIAEKQIPDKFVQENEVKQFGLVKIYILYPLSSEKDKSVDNLNNASIVNRLEYGQFSVLFTGDAEKIVQNQISNENIYATILKVPHHGSVNGLDEGFLKVVRPAVAVISVGEDNQFGHPATSTINLLKQYAVQIYRTDQNGTIGIYSDGKNYSISLF